MKLLGLVAKPLGAEGVAGELTGLRQVQMLTGVPQAELDLGGEGSCNLVCFAFMGFTTTQLTQLLLDMS